MKGMVINQILYMSARIRTMISTICSKASYSGLLSLLVIGSTLAVCVSTSSVVYADTLGYPWPTDTEAPCYYGTNGGSSCVNPADPTNQSYWYSWGVYDGGGTFHFYRNGYEYRNCTDYTQWKESTIGVSVPGTWGNGGQWYGNAPTNEQSTTAKSWDAAVVPGTIGHVAFVESVNTDGTITVSEYNHDTQGHGDTRTDTPANMGFTKYVDFGVHPTGLGGGQVASWAPSNVGFFARGSDGTTKQTYTTGGSWTGWSTIMGAINSEPASVSRTQGVIDLFAQGTDNSLVQADYSGVWPSWYSFGGCIANAPSVAAYGQNDLFVFYTGCSASGDNVGYKSWDSVTGWSGWNGLDGRLSAAPAAVSWASGRIDLLGRAMDNSLVWRHYDQGTGWSAWTALGGCLSSAPAVASWGPNRLDVFALSCGTGDNISWISFTGSGWGSWTSVPNGGFSAVPSAISQGSGQIDLFGYAQDSQQTLVTSHYANGTWSGWTAINPHP